MNKLFWLLNLSFSILCEKIKTFDIQHALASELNILYKFYLTTKFKYLITKKIIIWGNYWKKFYSHNTRCVSLGYFERNKFCTQYNTPDLRAGKNK